MPGVGPSSTAPGTDRPPVPPPPLPFDPSLRPPQPPTQADLAPERDGPSPAELLKPRARKAALWVLGGLGILMLASWMRGGVYITNHTNEVPLPEQITTTSLPNVPARALPVDATIGGYPVRRSALMIINGDVATVQSAVLETLTHNPGVGICQLYVGASRTDQGGVVITAARTSESEVQLVDCTQQPDPTTTIPATTTTTTGG